MPRVSTKRANKDYPDFGIKKGDTYYEWSFFRSRPIKSLTPPKQSQLTQTAMSRAYAAIETLEELLDKATCPQDVVDALNDAASEVRATGEEDYQESFDNLPENFQNAGPGEEMQEKIDGLSAWADDIESAASEVESLDADDYTEREKFEGGFDELEEGEQTEFMDAAREIASGVTDCPF